MTAQVRVYNDGPDDALVYINNKFRIRLSPGSGTVLATNKAVSFQPARQPTRAELAEHSGITMDKLPPDTPGRVAESD